MKSILKKYYIAFLLTLVMFLPVQTISAQTNTVYPVELNAFLTPPYTPCFMEYTEAGRFQLNIIRKDLYHKNWKFYVKMTVASFGGSSIVAYSDEISLGQGLHTPFLDFRQFIKNCPTLANCLKEGNYNLVFEAVDRSTGSDVSLSRPFTVSAYMERGKAPYLFAPYDEQNFPVGTAVTNFSWQLPKMTAEFLQYKLEVIDITDKGISANAAFESMLPQTPDGLCEYTTATSFVWNKALIDGHTYAWRVSAVNADKSPKTGFENNGISKVFSFTCGKKVDPFEEMMEKESEKILTSKKVDDDLDVLKMDKVEMSFKDIMAFWVKDNDEIRKKYSGVSIEIQPLGKDKWTPYSILYSESGDETLSLPILVDKDLTHVARGQYFILDEDGERIYAPYSDTIHFVIPGEPSDDPECGSPLPELSDCSGKNLPEKQDIQEIYCHGTKIDVESISSYSKNNDYIVLSGNGFLSFKFAKIFKLKVKFDNIKINCAKELMQGSVVTVYDEKNALKLDLNEIFGGKTVDGDQKTEQVESPTIKTTPSDTPGDFWKDGSDIKMRGADGSVITVGSVTSVSSLSYDNSEIKSDNENGTVRFTDATTPFDDDKLGLKDVLAGYYIPFDEGRLYYIPYVAVTHGNVSKVTVSVSDKCKDVKYIVKLSQDEVLELNVENGKVLVPGNNTTKSSQVYAISKNSEGKYVNVGSLLVSNFAVESKTLHIVPLTDETVSDASALQTYINNIYAGLGYEFKVSVENKLVDEWITENVLKDGGLKIAADDQSAWTSMTDEMKKVCSIYKEHNEDNVKDGDLYLFLVPNAEESKYKGTAGDLPRSQSVGFIFTDNAKPGTAEFNHTVAHELGHAFNLQHLFEHSKKIKQGSTSNLMDYNTVTSNDLLHFQWHNIHNERIWVWPVLEDDDDGLYRSWEHLGYTIIEKLEPNEYSFILRDGDKVLRFEIPNNAVDLGFCDSYLHSFTIDGERWIALFEDVDNKHIFKGFYKDAEKVGDFYRTKGKQKFQITEKLDVNGEYYFAVARTCPAIDVYKFSYVSGLSIKNDIEPRYESAKNNTFTSSYVRTVENYLNCLAGRKKEFFKFIIDHYNKSGITISVEDQKKLSDELSHFNNVLINGIDNTDDIFTEKIKFHELLNYGYLELIAKLNSLSKDLGPESLLYSIVVDFDDPAAFGTLFYLTEDIRKDNDLFECISQIHLFSHIKEVSSDANIFEKAEAVLADLHNLAGSVELRLLVCLMKQLEIPENVWNANRVDYKFKDLDLTSKYIVDYFTTQVGGGEWVKPIMDGVASPLCKFALICGAWNSIVDQLVGFGELAAEATDADVAENLKNFLIKLSDFKLSSLPSITDALKGHIGVYTTPDGVNVDMYKAHYAVGYDVIFIASFFVGIGEFKAIAAGKDVVEVLTASAKSIPVAIKSIPPTLKALRATGVKFVKEIPTIAVKLGNDGKAFCYDVYANVILKADELGIKVSENAKAFAFSSLLEKEILKFSKEGLKISNAPSDWSRVVVASSKYTVKSIDNNVGYLVISRDGACLLKSKYLVECANSFSTKLGDDLGVFIRDFQNASDDIVKLLNEETIESWQKLRNLNAIDEVRQNIKALQTLAYKKQGTLNKILDPKKIYGEAYVTNHLAKFNDGAACFTFTGTKQYGNLGRADGLFVMTKSEARALIKKANGDISVLEKELGIPEGMWQNRLDNGEQFLLFEFEKSELSNLRMPRGSEAGADPNLWIPGGHLPGSVDPATGKVIPGYSEAVVDNFKWDAKLESHSSIVLDPISAKYSSKLGSDVQKFANEYRFSSASDLQMLMKNENLVEAWQKLNNLNAIDEVRQNIKALQTLAYKKQGKLDLMLDPKFIYGDAYVAKHLAKFDDGAACFTFTGTKQYGTLGRADGLFVMTKSEARALMKKANGDISVFEKELGIPEEMWKQKLVRGEQFLLFEFEKSELSNLRMPRGSEAGADPDLWITGGHLPGSVDPATGKVIPGYNEAVVDNFKWDAKLESHSSIVIDPISAKYSSKLGSDVQKFANEYRFSSASDLEMLMNNETLVEAWQKLNNLNAIDEVRQNIKALQTLAYKKQGKLDLMLDPKVIYGDAYVAKHLAKFDDGAACFTFTGAKQYGTLGRADGLFVLTKSEARALMKKANGDISVFEKELGIPEGMWKKRLKDGEQFLLFEFEKSELSNLRMARGSEAGADPNLWITGGHLPGSVDPATGKVIPGYNEAIVDNFKWDANLEKHSSVVIDPLTKK